MMGITQLLYILNHYGLISDGFKNKFNETASLIDEMQKEIQADAEKITNHLFGKIPVIYVRMATRVWLFDLPNS